MVLIAFLLLVNLLTSAHKYGYITHAGESEISSASGRTDSTNIPYADTVDWSEFAYCQYVTSEDYLCNSLMIFESLVRLGAKAERMMLYDHTWTVDNSTHAGRLLAQARDTYGVRLVPIEVQRLAGEVTWAESFTKLLAFNQTSYGKCNEHHWLFRPKVPRMSLTDDR